MKSKVGHITLGHHLPQTGGTWKSHHAPGTSSPRNLKPRNTTPPVGSQSATIVFVCPWPLTPCQEFYVPTRLHLSLITSLSKKGMTQFLKTNHGPIVLLAVRYNLFASFILATSKAVAESKIWTTQFGLCSQTSSAGAIFLHEGCLKIFNPKKKEHLILLAVDREKDCAQSQALARFGVSHHLWTVKDSGQRSASCKIFEFFKRLLCHHSCSPSPWRFWFFARIRYDMWGCVYVAVGGIDPEPNRHVRAAKSDFTRLKWVWNPSVRRKLPCATLACQDFCTASTLRGSKVELRKFDVFQAGCLRAILGLPPRCATTAVDLVNYCEVPAAHPFCHAASAWYFEAERFPKQHKYFEKHQHQLTSPERPSKTQILVSEVYKFAFILLGQRCGARKLQIFHVSTDARPPNESTEPAWVTYWTDAGGKAQSRAGRRII